MFQTPILIIAFNRPDTTKLVLDAIRDIKPARLYVSIDGPRSENIKDLNKINEVKFLFKEISWDCKLTTLYNEKNLGCKIAVSNAISWFFEQEKEGIILEDDCLPHKSFFTFCEAMLQKYRNTAIWHISGSNITDPKSFNDSYHFSQYPGIWGWATWANKWQFYDANIASFKFNESLSRPHLKNISKSYWNNLFQAVQENKVDTWDYQWIYTIWENQGLAITPNRNLISNIGFGKEATHTHDNSHNLANLITSGIVNILHPNKIEINDLMDNYLTVQYFSEKTLCRRFFERSKIELKSLSKYLFRK